MARLVRMASFSIVAIAVFLGGCRITHTIRLERADDVPARTEDGEWVEINPFEEAADERSD